MNKETYIVPRQKAIHLDAEELLMAESPSPQTLEAGEEAEENGVAEVKAHNVWEEW